ncbi:MAG: hypothetical protein HQK99_16740 [Nitrospirae bacterium]|nr:hypothetical protein [Nitrospirota bacterium]
MATGRLEARLDKIEAALIPKNEIVVAWYSGGDSEAEILEKDAIVKKAHDSGQIIVVWNGGKVE